MKRTTGIPRSQLVSCAEDTAGAMLNPDGSFSMYKAQVSVAVDTDIAPYPLYETVCVYASSVSARSGFMMWFSTKEVTLGGGKKLASPESGYHLPSNTIGAGKGERRIDPVATTMAYHRAPVPFAGRFAPPPYPGWLRSLVPFFVVGLSSSARFIQRAQPGDR